ncbi:MAG: tetratricopeptide repeat protein [Smithella sp.]|jgi:tetratricopeptide (TPR) repeat protein
MIIKKKVCIVVPFLITLILFVNPGKLLADTQTGTLNQYISELQNNPNDTALREKIIRHVQTMKSAPKTPEEIDELVGQAKYVFKHAKTPEDYLGAVEAYKKIVNITPWVGDYYYNLGVAQEQAGQSNDAINSFKLYLLASPDARDAKEVRERIGGLKYAIEKAARESSPEVVEARQQTAYETWLKKIDGARYVRRVTTERDAGYFWVDINGNTVTYGIFLTWSKYSPEDVGKSKQWGNAKIVNKAFEGRRTDLSDWNFSGRISDDGTTLYLQDRTFGGRIEENIYHRER